MVMLTVMVMRRDGVDCVGIGIGVGIAVVGRIEILLVIDY